MGMLDKMRVLALVYTMRKKYLHKNAEKLACNLIKDNNPLGFFYLAEMKYLYGEDEVALPLNEKFLAAYPFHADGVYLHVKILQNVGKIELAWAMLENLLERSTRLKTWLIMANLVETKGDFQRIMNNYEKASVHNTALKESRVVKEYLSLAALKSAQYEEAKKFLREMVLSHQVSHSKNSQPKKFSVKNAAIALKELAQVLANHRIEMFLVSGTFLGCIREGKLLSFDKDLDVGIWRTTSKESLLKIVRASGSFYIQASRSPDIVRLTHISGTPIDVFYHNREGDRFWHGGIKARWYNKAFDLVKYKFLGQEYLGPKDYDLYLRENYGAWRKPKKDFDNVLDTPNAEVINEDEMVIHLLRLLMKKYSINNKEKILKKLSSYGERLFKY